MQHAPINNPTRHRLYEVGMRKAPEVVREIGVDDVRVTAEQPLLHLYDCLLGVAPSAVGVKFRRKVGFEDRVQYEQHGYHADPIPHARDAQRSEFAVGLWYKHSSDWLWPVGLLPESSASSVSHRSTPYASMSAKS